MASESFETSSSSGSSSGSSSSSSKPVSVNSPQTDWGLQLSQLLGTLAQNQYDWAHQQYAAGQPITDQNIAQYMQLAGQGAGLAQNLISRYRDVFEPLENQFIQQAGTYNSEERQRFMMGRAESTVGQADQAARDEAERKLQGFGINPNSGRYQDLLLTSRIQDAAARAGAGTQAALDTADRGRQMTQQAAQMGQNVPGMAVNALQSAYAGVTGAENAILGMLNTGANLTQSAAPYFNAAAANNKVPPVGQNTQSSSQQQSKNQSEKEGGSQNDGGKDGGEKGKKGSGSGQSDGSGGGSGRGTGAAVNPNFGGSDTMDVTLPPMQFPVDPSNYMNTDTGVINPEWSPGFARDQSGQLQTPDTANWDGPQAPNWGGYSSPDAGNSASDFTPFGNNMYSPPSEGVWDGAQVNGYSQQQQAPTDQGQSFDWNQYAQDSGAQNDYSGYSQQYQQQDQTDPYASQGGMPMSQDDTQQYDPYQTAYNDPNSDSSGYDDGGGDFSAARGGPVPPRGVLPTSGGAVSRGMSPSAGRQTDDVPARLNAGEFVVPRDVVAHKGSEFFQKLIANSRKMRTGMAGAPAQGQMKPPLPNMNRPRFVSQQMGAR